MNFRHFLQWMGLGIAFCQAAVSPVFAGNRTTYPTYEAEAAKAEALWPNQIPAYCHRYEQLIGMLASATYRNPSDIALVERLATTFLEKETMKPSNMPQDASAILLGTQNRVIETLLGKTEWAKISGEDCMRCATIAAWYFNTICRDVIPNYQPKPAPNISVGPTTPENRATYEAMIAENRRNNAINSKQHALKDILQLGEFQLRGYINDTTRMHPEVKEQGEEILRSVDLKSLEIEPIRIPSHD